MMRPLDRLGFAYQALTRHRWRAVLLVLAIASSVASVLMMTALGQGARNYVTAEFASLGKEMLVIIPGRKETTGGLPPMGSTLRDLTLEDMAYLQRRLPRVRIAPLVVGSSEAKFGTRLRNTLVLGTTAAFQQTHHLQILRGQGLPDLPPGQSQSVCLLGQQLALELFGNQDPVGQWLRLDDRRYRILGVFASTTSSMGLRMDENVVIPVGAAQALFNTQGLFRLFVQALAGQPLPGLSEQLARLMRERHQGVEDVTIMSPDALLQTFSDILLTLTLAVAGIGAISLLVSGIMLMNLSLINTHQRTAEIGLLKALGADGPLVRSLFLTEALLLSGSGALLGLGLGYLAVALARRIWPDFPAQVPDEASLAAVTCALLTGLVFAWLPASRAARKPVVDSLRGNL